MLNLSHTKQPHRLLVWLFSLCFLFRSEDLSSDSSNIYFPQTISQEDEQSLREFFHALFWGSEAGYVLYGDKPVCINHYTTKGFFSGVFSVGHHLCSSISEGMRVWKKLGLPYNTPRYLIFPQRCDPTGTSALLVIVNKKNLQKVFEENAVLFRHQLGAQLTAELLLNELLKGHEDFFFILKNDKVLIGLLLGFGLENALTVSRYETIRESLDSDKAFSPFPTWPSAANQQEPPAPFKNHLLKPSVGYASLEDELVFLDRKIEPASISLETYAPQLIFGRLSTASDGDLVRSYEKTQLEIIHILEQHNWLELLLSDFYSHPVSIQIEKKKDMDVKETNLPLIIARLLLTHLEIENFDCAEIRESFIEGLQAANQREDAHHIAPFPRTIDKLFSSKDHSFRKGFKLWSFYKFHSGYSLNDVVNHFAIAESDLSDPTAQQLHQEIFKNIQLHENQLAQKHFQVLKQDASVHCIAKEKLYYQQETAGLGNTVEPEQKIVISYKIFTASHHLIESKEKVALDLERTMKGFREALPGKREGEKGVLFVDPDWGLKFYATPPYYSPYLIVEFEIHAVAGGLKH